MKVRIKSYKKVPQSFIQSINNIDEATGNVMEPYTVRLEKFYFFGLVKIESIQSVEFPRGFDHKKELKTGREWVN